MKSAVKLYKPTAQKKVSENIFSTKIPDLYYIRYPRYEDERGFFAEILKLPELEKILGHEMKIKQINFSLSKENVIRGLHAEDWNKLVTVISGRVFSAIVDINPDSPTFKQTEYFELSANENEDWGMGLYLPSGLANSICSLQGNACYLYGVDKLYKERNKKGDMAISIFDPDLKIEWPLPKKKMILSDRDKKAVTMRKLFPDSF